MYYIPKSCDCTRLGTGFDETVRGPELAPLDRVSDAPPEQGTPAISARDPHCFSKELDESATQRLADRLEARAKDEVFARLFDQYVDRLGLPATADVLEVGCGTGAACRALARRAGFEGTTVGIDQSPGFIQAAERLAREEGVGDRVRFELGDAHQLPFDDESFDAVIGHTLISHVADPKVVVREMARVVRSAGTVAIFDGDYSSLTYAHPDRELGRTMNEALATATFSNPLIMRELPCVLAKVGLQITQTLADVVAEIGKASYFRSFAETYAPFVAEAGLLSSQAVDQWLSDQRRAMEDGTFFASCNYYTYLARRT